MLLDSAEMSFSVSFEYYVQESKFMFRLKIIIVTLEKAFII